MPRSLIIRASDKKDDPSKVLPGCDQQFIRVSADRVKSIQSNLLLPRFVLFSETFGLKDALFFILKQVRSRYYIIVSI